MQNQRCVCCVASLPTSVPMRSCRCTHTNMQTDVGRRKCGNVSWPLIAILLTPLLPCPLLRFVKARQRKRLKKKKIHTIEQLHTPPADSPPIRTLLTPISERILCVLAFRLYRCFGVKLQLVEEQLNPGKGSIILIGILSVEDIKQ